jgi:hypothetical protein
VAGNRAGAAKCDTIFGAPRPGRASGHKLEHSFDVIRIHMRPDEQFALALTARLIGDPLLEPGVC